MFWGGLPAQAFVPVLIEVHNRCDHDLAGQVYVANASIRSVMLLDHQARIVKQSNPTAASANNQWGFPVRLSENQSQQYFLLVEGNTYLRFTPGFCLEAQCDESASSARFTYFFNGAMAIVLLHNLFLFLLLRDKIHLYYSIYVLSSYMLVTAEVGFDITPLHELFPRHHHTVLFVSIILMFTSSFLLIDRLFGLKSKYPLLYRLLSVIVFVVCASTLARFVDHSWLNTASFKLYQHSSRLGMAAVFLLGLYLIYQRQRFALVFTISWGVLVSSGILLSLTSSGQANHETATIVFKLGILVETLLLNYILAMRYKDERKRRMRTEINALHSRHAQQLAEVEAQSLAKEKSILEQQQSMKDNFFASMSHEFRTPLHGIMGMTELLKETPLTAMQKRYASLIQHSSDALLSIINDILDHSKIESGKMTIEHIECDLNEILHASMGVFSLRALEKHIPLLFEVDASVPVRFYGDPVRIKQIIVNFVSNAYKFTERGAIKIRVETLPQASGEASHLCFLVQDTGIGLTAEQMQKLFTPYQQAEDSTSRKFGGTGLGLSICKHLSELMGGEVGVESQYGDGSTFWFSIKLDPIADALPSANVSKAHRLRQVFLQENASPYIQTIYDFLTAIQAPIEIIGSEQDIHAFIQQGNTADPVLILDQPSFVELEPERREALCNAFSQVVVIMEESMATESFPENLLILSPPVSPLDIREIVFKADDVADDKNRSETMGEEVSLVLSVLIAEDNKVNQHIISALLKKIGAEFELCENGQDVFQTYADHSGQFDVILMDCEMPVMDGYEATREIRAWEQQQGGKPIPIIGLSAHAEKELMDRAYASGMSDYMTKPVQKELLINKLLGLKETKRQQS